MKDETVNAMTGAMAIKTDGEIKAALDDYCPGWTLEEVKRCGSLVIDGHGIEVFYWNRVPLLELHPIRSEIERTDTSFIVKATRNYRRLFKAPDQTTEAT